MIKKKQTYITYIGIAFIIIFLTTSVLYNNKKIEKNREKMTDNSYNLIEYTFFEYGTIKSRTNLYQKEKDKYSTIGSVEANTKFHFSKLIDNYLLISDFEEEYYVKISDVESSNEEVGKEERYKKYIPFNENIITNTITNFYNEKDELLYTIQKSYSFPIIIKDKDKYGIEYNHHLVYIQKEDVASITEANNTEKKNASGVGVLNYHFFYDDEIESERNECNQEICVSKSQLQKEIEYLKENNILTITASELEFYIDGKINLPKSVLITIDDGYMMNLGIRLFEENQMYACVFLITSWFDKIDFLNDYKYIEFNSHGENLHKTGVCPGGQGGGIKCLSRDNLLNDLKTSRSKLNGSTFFAYPFYEYNTYSISVLKESGITLAFAGESSHSDNLVHEGSNKYTLPRFIMVNYTTIANLDNYLKNIH